MHWSTFWFGTKRWYAAPDIHVLPTKFIFLDLRGAGMGSYWTEPDFPPDEQVSYLKQGSYS